MLLLYLLSFVLFLLLLLGLKRVNFFRLADRFLSYKFTRNGLQLKFYAADKNSQISYWIGGSGPTLVLIHGFGAPAKFQWDRQLKTFVQSYQLIIPNLLYFGDSQANNNDFSPNYQAEYIQQLLEHLKVERCCVVGISYGGVVAVLLANQIPHKIKKLGICDSPIRYFTEQDIEKTLQNFAVSSIEELLVPAYKEALIDLTSIAFHKAPPIPRFVLQDAYDGLVVPQVTQKKALLKYLFDHREDLSALEFCFNCPVLLIWGTYDRLIPPRIGEQLLDYFGTKQAQLHLIDKAAHLPNVEQSTTFNNILATFLETTE